jgi:hypothetical protein
VEAWDDCGDETYLDMLAPRLVEASSENKAISWSSHSSPAQDLLLDEMLVEGEDDCGDETYPDALVPALVDA